MSQQLLHEDLTSSQRHSQELTSGRGETDRESVCSLGNCPVSLPMCVSISSAHACKIVQLESLLTHRTLGSRVATPRRDDFIFSPRPNRDPRIFLHKMAPPPSNLNLKGVCLLIPSCGFKRPASCGLMGSWQIGV